MVVASCLRWNLLVETITTRCLPKLSFTSNYPVSSDDLFAWHQREGSLHRLTPPWVSATVDEFEGIADGKQTVMRIGKGPFQVKWVTKHGYVVPSEQFVDHQESGPFAYWRHAHLFSARASGGSRLTDEIDFELKGGTLGERLSLGFVKSQLERAFTYRHRITGQDLLLHKHYNLSNVSLRIAISGSSGLIGSALAAFLSSGGHKVLRLVRRRSTRRGDVYWNPATGEIDRASLEGIDVIINLAGDSALAWRYDAGKQERIMRSRLDSTRLLAQTLSTLENPPSVFLSASGTSVYGSHGSLAVTEASSLKSGGFLSSVAKEWEAAAAPAMKAGVRTVYLRFGAVLSPRGGILKKILPLFQSGFGGSVSQSEQWVSWISLDDVLGAVYHVMMSTAAGAVNLVAPHPVSAEAFASTLARVLRRPAFLRVPKKFVKPVVGDVAEEVLFESVRAHPEYLSSSGYRFLYPTLEGTLRHLLGKKPPSKLDLSAISGDAVSVDFDRREDHTL